MKILTDSIVIEPFDERVEILADELEFAIEYNRAAILLAVYQSEFVRADVEAALAERLRPLEQRLERVFINEGSYDLPLYLRQRADAATTVYCVSGLRFGGGEDGRNAYRALNIRREYFVDDQMRVIFWLTESEDRDLPRYAPDFWAFRHRTVEFMDEPQPHHIDQYADELTWRGWHGDEATGSPAFTEDTAAKIAYREQLLNDLPNTPERTIARSRLWYALAPLYTAQGEYEKAIAASKQAIALDPKYASPHGGLGIMYRVLGRHDEAIKAYKQAIALDPKYASPHHGLGNIHYQNGRYDEAIKEYNQAIALDPKYASPHHGLGNVYYQYGRYNEAIKEYSQAIALDPKDAYPHMGLGIMYKYLGRYDEAIKEYNQAIALDPKNTESQMALAAIYRKLGQTAVYNQQIEIARPLITNASPYNRACFASIAGDVEEAVALLKEAIAIAPRYRKMAQNDPDFEFIRDDPRFQAVVGGA